MLRLLLLIGLMSVGLTLIPSDVRAQGGAWDACRGRVGPSGPELEDCRPLAGVVDPQGREMWLRRTIDAPADPMPQALYIVGVASSEVWLNGRPLGRNGMPGADGPSEAPGMYQAVLPIRDGLWRPTGNDLVVHLSSFHGGLRLRYPVGTIDVAPYPYPRAEWLIGAKLFAAGALFAATFGFGVIHGIRRTSSSLTLACMAAAAGLHALLESLNLLVAYPYPLHVWRLVGIWALAVAFAILLVDFVAIRVWPSARRRVVPAASALIFGSILVQGYDGKTAWALGIGLAVAAALAAVGAWRRTPGAAVAFGYLVVFLAVAVMQPAWFTDLSYFLLAALLVLPR